MAKQNGNGKTEIPAGFEFHDLSDWRMKDFRRFQRTVQTARNEDIFSYFELCTEVIKEWPFDYAGEPSDANAYEELKPPDWAVVDDIVGVKITGIFQR